MGALSADVAAIIRELPAKVAAVEAALKAKAEQAGTAVESAGLPAKLQAWEDELAKKIQSYETTLAKYIADLQGLNIPSRVATIEAEIAALKNFGNVTQPPPNPPAVQGTAAQRTAPPATVEQTIPNK